MTLLDCAIAAQAELAETRARYARNGSENCVTNDARRLKIAALERERDAAAASAGTTAVELDCILYGQ